MKKIKKIKNKLKVLLVGCGRIGAHTTPETLKMLNAHLKPYSHADAIVSIPDLKLSGVCDASAEQALKTGIKFRTKSYSDLNTALSEIKPHIVSIATRGDVRPSIIRSSLKAGVKSLMIEKPLTHSWSETKKLITLFKEYGSSVVYGAFRRYSDVFMKVKKILDNGEIGTLKSMVASYGYKPLMWTHPHSIDTFLFFNNGVLPTQVSAQGDYEKSKVRGDVFDQDLFLKFAHIDFKNGVSGIINPAPGDFFTLYGESGIIRINCDFDSVEIIKRKNDKITQRKILKIKPKMSARKRMFVELIRGETNYDSILTSQQVLFMIVQSAVNRGQAVTPKELKNWIVTGSFNGCVA